MLDEKDVFDYYTNSIFHLGGEIDEYKKLSFQYLNDTNKMIIGISIGAIVLILNTQTKVIGSSALLITATILFLTASLFGLLKNRLISKFYMTASGYLQKYLEKIQTKIEVFFNDEKVDEEKLEKITDNIGLDMQEFYRINKISKIYNFIQNASFIIGIILMSIHLLF